MLTKNVSPNIDSVKGTRLTLFDLSADFETIVYSVLLGRLFDWHGTLNAALTWIHSLLTNRSQSIKIRNCFSEAVPGFCGVPQVSVLGPSLFTLYANPLSSLIHSHKLDHHLYTNDTQIYISLSTEAYDLSLTELGDGLSDTSGWMKNKILGLNTDEIDFVIIGTFQAMQQIYSFLP